MTTPTNQSNNNNNIKINTDENINHQTQFKPPYKSLVLEWDYLNPCKW